MSEDEKFSVAVVIGVILIAVFCLGGYIGEHNAISSVQKEAILHHAAHYETDSTGNPVFTWNTPETKSP